MVYNCRQLVAERFAKRGCSLDEHIVALQYRLDDLALVWSRVIRQNERRKKTALPKVALAKFSPQYKVDVHNGRPRHRPCYFVPVPDRKGRI